MVAPDYELLRTKYHYSDNLLIEIELFYEKHFQFITRRKNVDGEYENHLKQELALQLLTDSETKEVGYGGAAGGAKSWTGCSWEMMICISYPGVKGFIAREQLKDLRMSSLKTFQKVSYEYHVSFEKYWRYDGKDNVIIFTNGSTIDLLAIAQVPSDLEYQWLGSLEYTFGWVEESGEAKTNMAYEILKTRIGRHLNDKYGILPTIFNTFNPKKNYVYTYFYERDKNGRLPAHIKFIKALIYDNPHRESGYAEQLEAINIPAQRARLLEGNFDYDDDPTVLCDYDAICDMFRNEHVIPGDKYGSADLAMQGRDKFVAGHWEGLVGYPSIIKDKATGKEIEGDIKGLMLAHSIPHSRFVVDSTGMGSYLESYIEGIKEFNFAMGANDPAFLKLKDECGYKLADVVNKRQIHIICSEEVKEFIKQEMGVLRAADIDSDTKKQRIISKSDMKGYLGRSPDFLDWLILRMWFQCTGNEALFPLPDLKMHDAGSKIPPVITMGVLRPAVDGGNMVFLSGSLVGNKVHVSNALYDLTTDIPACVDFIAANAIKSVIFSCPKEYNHFGVSLRSALTAAKSGCSIRIANYTGDPHTRILAQSAFITNHFLFRDDYEKLPQYNKFMKNLTSYLKVGGNAHDDGADAAAELAKLFRSQYKSLW